MPTQDHIPAFLPIFVFSCVLPFFFLLLPFFLSYLLPLPFSLASFASLWWRRVGLGFTLGFKFTQWPITVKVFSIWPIGRQRDESRLLSDDRWQHGSLHKTNANECSSAHAVRLLLTCVFLVFFLVPFFWKAFKMAHRALEVGSEVMAKWPGSDRYFEAIVQEEMRGTFVVLFTDGGGYEAKVPKGHVYVSEKFERFFSLYVWGMAMHTLDWVPWWYETPKSTKHETFLYRTWSCRWMILFWLGCTGSVDF